MSGSDAKSSYIKLNISESVFLCKNPDKKKAFAKHQNGFRRK